jgi:hypothetical protein
MKTNQLLKINMFGNEIDIEHLTYYGNLNQLFDIGNIVRVSEGKKPLQMQSFLQSKQVQEHCKYIEEDPIFKVSEKGIFYKEGKGATTKTKAHLMIMVLAAQNISSKFHYEFNKKVILDRLLEWRDSSGDSFKSLNVVMDSKLAGDISKNRYIKLAVAIKNRVKPNEGDWNKATAEQLKKRSAIEDTLISLMMLDRVKDINDACDLVTKI